jgi:hypothetical protein
MKTFLTVIACAAGILCFTPTADAGYRRTIVGYDSRGNAIVQVTWEADHLDFPRTIYDRRTYSTSVKRDPSTLYYPPSTYYPYYTPVNRAPAPEREPYSAYSTYNQESENSD